MNKKMQLLMEELGISAGSLDKLRKSELLDLLDAMAEKLAVKAEPSAADRKQEVKMLKLEAELEGTRRELEIWKKRFAELQLKSSNRIGYGGVRNPNS